MSNETSNYMLMEGLQQFDNAHTRAFWQDIINHLTLRPIRLMSFEEVKTKLRLREEHYVGLQDVPVDQIVGSVGRYRDFNKRFLPLKESMRHRWGSIYAQFNTLEGLPPIELYQVGDVYFVRDGNHRVSVAKELDMATIEAYVTELDTPIEVQPDMSLKDWDAAEAYADFLDKTHLKQTRPDQEPLTLQNAVRYQELLGHIYFMQELMAYHSEEPIALEEAATRWYDRVYLPLVEIIRSHNMLEDFPKRTEAELYLWIVDHLQQLIKRYGEALPKREFSDAVLEFLLNHEIEIHRT